MSLQHIEPMFTEQLALLDSKGVRKGNEQTIVGIEPPRNGLGPRYMLAGTTERLFLRMNANSYLGLASHPQVIEAEKTAAEQFGCGPGAVRFISGTYGIHHELETALADFHGRQAGMLFSCAYAAVTGILPQLITPQTLVISDSLNHNCIINGIRLAQPMKKALYPHLDMNALATLLETNQGSCQRVVVVTDGIFSMRGDHAPLDAITALCQQYENGYQEGIITVVDDSHGVGAFGKTGRGTVEYTGARADLYIATLGKAMGVNGGYVVSSQTVVDFLRETSPFYIYSNPITPAEAAAALAALRILNSEEGLGLLQKIRNLATRLREGLGHLGIETIRSDHPIVPLLIRDTAKTADLVHHLFEHNVLATGLNYPVVPKGEEEIRLQVSASHTVKDMEYLLQVLAGFSGILPK